MRDEFAWNEDYCIGVEEVDAGHRELVGLLQGLGRMAPGSDAAVGGVRTLIECCVTHFCEEEALMRACAYPEYPAHRQIHAALIDHVRGLQGRLERGQLHFDRALHSFLQVWLMRHICEVDRRFGAYHAAFRARESWLPALSAGLAFTRPWARQ